MPDFLLYDDALQKRAGGRTKYYEQDATGAYIKHYRNYIVLKYIALSDLSDFETKSRARYEMNLAERKMEHWTRHVNFSMPEAVQRIVRIENELRLGK